jgi:hypothetical protein
LPGDQRLLGAVVTAAGEAALVPVTGVVELLAGGVDFGALEATQALKSAWLTTFTSIGM